MTSEKLIWSFNFTEEKQGTGIKELRITERNLFVHFENENLYVFEHHG